MMGKAAVAYGALGIDFIKPEALMAARVGGVAYWQFTLARCTVWRVVISVVVVCVLFASAQICYCVPYVRGIRANPMEVTLEYFKSPELQAELKATPEQAEKVEELRLEMNAKLQALFKLAMQEEPDKRNSNYVEAGQKLGVETEQRLGEILSAKQLKRLKEIVLQIKLANDTPNALTGDEVAKTLGLTLEQKEQIKKQGLELRREVIEKGRQKPEEFDKLQDEARERLLRMLTPAQRSQFQDLLGEKFDWESSDWFGTLGLLPRVKPTKK